MKLYAFRPNGHGPQSFFVIAESDQEARALVDARVERGISEHDSIFAYGANEWRQGNYEMEAYEPGEVAANQND